MLEAAGDHGIDAVAWLLEHRLEMGSTLAEDDDLSISAIRMGEYWNCLLNKSVDSDVAAKLDWFEI